ncbi:UNVERIFIED_ORG: hypothetical protein J2W38_002781 [Variovorax paradoxus]|nr:hypothetical protein [Variovorax paradoxus]
MWKPAQPIILAGAALTDQEAWWYEFKDAFHELFAGKIDEEWLDGLTATLYQVHMDHDPRDAAAVAYATLTYEVPGNEPEEPFTPPPGRPGLP